MNNPLAKTGLMGGAMILIFIGAEMIQDRPELAGGYVLCGCGILLMLFKYITTNKRNNVEE